MYHEFYGLNSPPFENTPDPRFFFASDQHREALAAIEYTIRMRKGIVLITGEIGSGKTTIGHTMWARCADRATIAEVSHGHGDATSLVKQILRSLGLALHAGDDHAVMLERLRGFLSDRLNRTQPVVLFVDDAQALPDVALEELRLLSNFDTDEQKLIQIILVGQPELRERLRGPNLAALRQRIVMAKQLEPLGAEDTAAYIQHRIRAAAVDPSKLKLRFEPAAIDQIYRFSRGIPRLINVACDNCLLLGFVRRTDRITAEIVQRVIEDSVPNFGDPVFDEHREQEALSPAGSL